MLYCVPLCSCGNCDIRHMVTWITPLVGEDKQMQGGILQGILCQQCCHQDIFCRSVNLIWWPDNGQVNMDQTEFAHFEQRSIICETGWQSCKWASLWNGSRQFQRQSNSSTSAQWATDCSRCCPPAPTSPVWYYNVLQCILSMAIYYNVLPKLAHLLKQRHSSKICKTKSYTKNENVLLFFLCKQWNFNLGGWQGKCDV